MLNLPKPKLSRQEALNLWIQTKSEYAKEQMILSNQALVIKVLKSLNLDIFDEDLYMTGIIGLCKAVYNFEPDKTNSFSAYAVPSIRNEILQTLRKKRIIPAFSLDETISGKDDDKTSVAELVADDKDIEKDAIERILIQSAFGVMNDREKEIIFLTIQGARQTDIGRILKISQSQVSRLIKSAHKKINKELGVS